MVNGICKKDSAVFLFLISSMLFGFLMYKCNVFSDDLEKMYLGDSSITACLASAKEMYFTWSSRVLINFLIFYFTTGRKILWAITMGVCMYILQNAMRILFVEKGDEVGIWMIAALTVVFPYIDLSSAGWIATMTTYFLPIAFGFMALVPIKKCMDEKRVKWWEMVFYMVCAAISANNEQVAVILLSCYSVMFFYLLIRKKTSAIIVILFMISLLEIIFELMCPGNSNRTVSEIVDWFPTYGMMNLIDKIDLGFATTARYLIFNCNVPVMMICMILAALIWKRYRDSNIRVISLLPVLLTLIIGPFSEVLSQVFRSFYLLKKDISIYGLFTPENASSLYPGVQYTIYAVFLGCILIEIYLLSDMVETLAASVVLAGAGFVSRAVIAFSPTIWASKNRTCAAMEFCVIAVGILLLSANKKIISEDRKLCSIVLTGCKALYVLGFLNLALQIYEITC